MGGKEEWEQPSELYTTDEKGRSTSRVARVHETVWASVRDSRHEPDVLETSRPTSGVSERATALDLCMSGLLRRNIQFNSIHRPTVIRILSLLSNDQCTVRLYSILKAPFRFRGRKTPLNSQKTCFYLGLGLGVRVRVVGLGLG